jgi:hypothetical protein
MKSKRGIPAQSGFAHGEKHINPIILKEFNSSIFGHEDYYAS